MFSPTSESTSLYWSSRSEVFCKKGVLKSFVKFTGKHVCQSLFFNKVTSLRPYEFGKNFTNTFFIEHLWWMLLIKKYYFSRGSRSFLLFAAISVKRKSQKIEGRYIHVHHNHCSALRRNNHPEVFYEKGVPKNLAVFIYSEVTF